MVTGRSNEEQLPSVGSVVEIDALPASTDTLLVKCLDDPKARALGRLDGLRVLYQDGNASGLTDEGVEALAALPNLETLDLEWAGAITDRAIATLERMPRLSWLDLGGCCHISESAIEELRLAKPNLELA
jgi:hypothetical protein